MSARPPSLDDAFAGLEKIMQILRDPKDGCPWDAQQTHESISSALIEEAYETYQAILDFDAHNATRVNELKEELGDLLFQVVFHAQLANEKNLFNLNDVAKGIAEKLIHRHPHVFKPAEDNEKKLDAQGTLKKWEQIKRREKENLGNGFVSMMASLPAHLPSLQKAQRMGQKAARVNFDWTQSSLQNKADNNPLWQKFFEKWGEFKTELPNHPDDFNFTQDDHPLAEQKQRAQEELGDLLFTLAQMARHYHLEAEQALYQANRKFASRFAFMEEEIHARLLQADFPSPQEWEALWQKAKFLPSALKKC